MKIPQVFRSKTVNAGDKTFTIGALNFLEDFLETAGAQLMQRTGAIPRHMAFCMDGNRRFARKFGLDAGGGHVLGFVAMVRILVACHRMGVKVVTVYAFSIENFNRSPEESQVLFDLVRINLWNMVNNRDSAMRRCDWHVRFPGHRSMLEPDVIERIESIENITAGSTGMIVNVCAPYTTRDDICTALAESASENQVSRSSIEHGRHLADAPPLDIFVRTSGETRLSDFMAWEIDSNCSLEFVPELWPELTVWRLFWIVAKWQDKRKREGRLALGLIAPSPPLVTVSKSSRKAKTQ